MYTERHRLARLHGDAPEHFVDAELCLDFPDEVVRPNRNAARGDEYVRLQAARDRSPVSVVLVLDRWEPLDLGAGGGERGRSHEAVRLVHLSRLQGLARAPELRSRREHRHARPPRAASDRNPGGGESTELGGTEPRISSADGRAGADVAATRADVRARRNRL